MCKSISKHEACGLSYRSHYGRSGSDSDGKIHGDIQKVTHWSHCLRQAEKWQFLCLYSRWCLIIRQWEMRRDPGSLMVFFLKCPIFTRFGLGVG